MNVQWSSVVRQHMCVGCENAARGRVMFDVISYVSYQLYTIKCIMLLCITC